MKLHNDVEKIDEFVGYFVELASVDMETLNKLAKDKKWIQKAVKKPGRFEGWSLGKMKKRYDSLKNQEDKTKAEVSEMKALALGIRFKGGDVPGGKAKAGI